MDIPENLVIPDPIALERKLSGCTINNSRVVTDFDSTITADNGKTSWSLFANSGLMPDEYVAERQALKDLYYPYEVDATLSADFRCQKMREWWIGHLSLFKKHGLRSDILEKIVSYEMIIRKGMNTFLHQAKQKNIPVLILSAGISQSIEAVLNHNDLLTENISIASNSLIFDTNGICSGVNEEQIIHVANKDEWDASEKIREKFAGRPNIILFGDSLDDIRMVETELRDNTIAVGFCTSNRKHQKKLFLNTFDIIVESDHSDEGVGEWLISQLQS